MRIGILSTACFATAIAASPLGAQQRPDPGKTSPAAPSFDNSRPPGGVVLDPAGRPISGADVRFRVGRGSQDAMYWRDSILRSRPLPRVRSSRDGEFFLPLTREHRLFTPGNSGTIHLVVQKEGFHPWIEPLSCGLRGYLGSRVVLQPIADGDRLTIEVKDPRPGMLVRVNRHGGGLDFDQWLPVPESGTLTTAVSFVPTPLAVDSTANLSVPLGIEVSLVFPGRSTAPRPLRYGERRVVLGDLRPESRFVCTLRTAAGRPEAPRGLYRCADGSCRWFPVDPDRVVESPLLPLFALDAKDCLATEVRYLDPAKENVLLAPVPDPAARVLELRDDRGEPVLAAQAWFFDLEDLPSRDEGEFIGWARARRTFSVADGRLDLGGRRIPGPGFLFVQAPGFAPHIVFEPRASVGTRRLDLVRRIVTGDLELTVTDDEGRPLSGIHVILNGSAARFGAFARGLPRTDARGKVTIGELPPGNHSVRLIGAGRTESGTMVRINSRTTATLTTQLLETARYRVLLVDDEGRPLPFRAVRSYATYLDRNRARQRSQLQTNTVAMSDSLGRILVVDLPSGVVPRIDDELGVAVRPSNVQLPDGEDLVRVDLVRFETVLMPLPDASLRRECLLGGGRPSNRALVSRPGCGAMMVRFPRAQGSLVLTVYLNGGPPVRLTDEIVAAARRDQGEGLLVIDQREEVRQVRLRFGGLAGARVEDLRIELPGMNFVGDRPYLYGNSGLQLRRAGEGFEIGLRDHGAIVAKVMHPEFLLRDLEIPASPPVPAPGPGGAGPAAAAPIDVALQRGTEVVFRLKSNVALQPGWRFNLYVHDESNQTVLYQREELRESNLRPVGADTWELRLPFALVPGKYFFSVRVYNTQLNLSRRQFAVPEKGPLVIEINKTTGRVPELRAAADLNALEERVKRLRSSAESLRKMGETDAKSKERLQKVLGNLEAQLQTYEKELERLRAQEKERTEKERTEKERKEQKAQEGKDQAGRPGKDLNAKGGAGKTEAGKREEAKQQQEPGREKRDKPPVRR